MSKYARCYADVYPTAAPEVLLNLPPLDLYVKEDAVATALRVHGQKQITQGNMTGHSRILMEFPNYELTSTLLMECQPFSMAVWTTLLRK